MDAQERMLLDNAVKDIAVMEQILENLNDNLYGRDGREGMIEKLEKRVERHDKWIYIVTGALFILQFLVGAQVFSLKSILSTSEETHHRIEWQGPTQPQQPQRR